jgi:hypothetical protein
MSLQVKPVKIDQQLAARHRIAMQLAALYDGYDYVWR